MICNLLKIIFKGHFFHQKEAEGGGKEEAEGGPAFGPSVGGGRWSGRGFGLVWFGVSVWTHPNFTWAAIFGVKLLLTIDYRRH